ncbi:MAG: type II secretion system protein [Solirubrobacterales bacterium]
MIKRTNKGFTLIELIVVIAVLLVLAGFLFPKFAGYQAKARETKAINTGKQIQTAAMSSYSEHEGIFDAAAVTSAVSTLTGAQGVSTTVADDKKSIKVSFTSDSENYNTAIDDNNNFTVYKGSDTTNKIYPQ